MELTLKYYHYFGDEEEKLGSNLNNSDSWDALRIKDGMNSSYYIPKDRDEWQKICLSRENLKLKAKEIVGVLKPKFNCLHSFGVGAAHLEFLIKREDSSLQLRCSDFTPQGIARLKKVFVEADEISNFDMIDGDWGEIDSKGVCLFYRVDTVFDDQQWNGVLYKMKRAGIKDALFIPSDILTLKKILYLQLKYAIFWLLRRKMTFSGFLRTKPRLVSLLSKFYEIVQVVDVGGSMGFLLKLRVGNK